MTAWYWPTFYIIDKISTITITASIIFILVMNFRIHAKQQTILAWVLQWLHVWSYVNTFWYHSCNTHPSYLSILFCGGWYLGSFRVLLHASGRGLYCPLPLGTGEGCLSTCPPIVIPVYMYVVWERQRASLVVSGRQRAPVSVSGCQRAPVAVSGCQRTPVAVSGCQRAPVAVSGCQQTPVAVSGCQRAPVAVLDRQRAPVAVPGRQRVPVSPNYANY